MKKHAFSRGYFLRLSAMTAGGAVLVGCGVEQGGGPPGSKGGGGGEVDASKLQAEENPELENLPQDRERYHPEPVAI